MGKSSFLYTLGLSFLVAIAIWNINGTATSAISNSADYFGRTMAHNIALAGANIATQQLFRDTSYSEDLSDQQFSGGTFDTYVDRSSGIVTITSVSHYENNGQTLHDTVIATFRHTPFAKYAYFSEAEQNGYLAAGSNAAPSGVSMWKITGDSLLGYAHTNGNWHLGGTPFFRDKVTATTGPSTMLVGGVYDPIFAGGYQWGLSVNRPQANIANLEGAAAASVPPALLDGNDVALTFFADGTVSVKIPPGSGTVRNDTVSVGTLTSNGIIAVKNGDLRIKGTYHGQLTLLSLGDTACGGTKGNIWIDGDLLAADDPRTDPSSNDMLGLVAERMTYVTTTDIYRDESSVVNIEAAIYCQKGVFAAENYSTIPVSGRIRLFGSLTMGASTSTGYLGNSGAGYYLEHGFLKSIEHDPRYLSAAPPRFPVSDRYELVSWWER